MPGPKQTNLNRAFPAAKKAGMGDAIAELIARVNTLQTQHNALCAKLDADAVENNAKAAFPLTIDTNYAALTGVTGAAVVDLESRLTTT